MRGNDQDRIVAEILSASAHFILEGGELPRMYGDPDQIRVIRRAALASRRFYESLCSESTTMDAVNVMLEERRRAAEDFKRVVGREWTL